MIPAGPPIVLHPIQCYPLGTVHAPLSPVCELGKGLEIERIHKRPGLFERRSAEDQKFEASLGLRYIVGSLIQWHRLRVGRKLQLCCIMKLKQGKGDFKKVLKTDGIAADTIWW